MAFAVRSGQSTDHGPIAARRGPVGHILSKMCQTRLDFDSQPVTSAFVRSTSSPDLSIYSIVSSLGSTEPAATKKSRQGRLPLPTKQPSKPKRRRSIWSRKVSVSFALLPSPLFQCPADAFHVIWIASPARLSPFRPFLTCLHPYTLHCPSKRSPRDARRGKTVSPPAPGGSIS